MAAHQPAGLYVMLSSTRDQLLACCLLKGVIRCLLLCLPLVNYGKQAGDSSKMGRRQSGRGSSSRITLSGLFSILLPGTDREPVFH